ncbi:MAG: ABC transporter permease [Anaerolineales bacterium]|nr:ABC transporter permease [Anaerolineales bacterium]
MLADLALKNLWRRRGRALLTIFAVAVMVQLHILSSSMLSTYRQDIQRQLAAFAGKVLVQQFPEDSADTPSSSNFVNARSSLENDTALALLDLPGLDQQASSAVLLAPLARSPIPDTTPSLLVVGIQPGREAAYLGAFQAERGDLRLQGDHALILGTKAAEHFRDPASAADLQPGAQITLLGESFTLAGVLETAPSLFNNAVLIPLETAQVLLGREETVSAVILTAAQIEDVPGIQASLAASFPHLQAATQEEMLQNAGSLMSQLDRLSSAITATAVGVGVVIIMIVVVQAVLEQRSEIGTLRAIGARRWRIYSLVLSESLVQSLLGAVLALPIAVLILRVAMGWQTFTTLLPTWLETLTLAVLIGVLASLLPAWQAVHINPIEALYYE